MRRALLALILLALVGCTPNWSTFRADDAGTGSNPQETSISTTTVSRLAQTWQVPAQSNFQMSAPLVAGGTVFVAQQYNGSPLRSIVSAYSLATGAVKWSHSFPSDLAMYGLSGSLVLLSNQPSSPGGLLALQQSDGPTAWSWSGAPAGEWATRSAVTGDGRIYAPFSDDLYAFDPTTGRLLWRHSCQEFNSCEFNLSLGIAFGQHHVYVAGGNRSAGAALDPATGRVQFTYASTQAAQLFQQPVVVGDQVVAPGEDSNLPGARAGQVAAFPAAGCGQPVCRSRWNVFLQQPALLVATAGGRLFVRSVYDAVDALDPATGRTLWHGITGGTGSSSVDNIAVAGNLVYATSGQAMYAFPAAGCASGQTCRPVWSKVVSDREQRDTPIVIGGRLLYLDYEALHALSPGGR